MGRVLVEHTFDPPIGDDAYGALLRKLDVCLDIRDAILVRGYLAASRGRGLSEVEAGDAQSVRHAMRSAGVPFDRAFAVELVEPVDPEAPPAGGVLAVVEAEGEALVEPSFPGMTWIRTCWSTDRRHRVSEVAGPDETAVLAACEPAGERVWIAAHVHRIEDRPDLLAKRARLRARLGR